MNDVVKICTILKVKYLRNIKATVLIASHYSAPIHCNFYPKSIQLNSLSERKTPKYIDRIGQKRRLGSSAKVQSVLPYNALES